MLDLGWTEYERNQELVYVGLCFDHREKLELNGGMTIEEFWKSGKWEEVDCEKLSCHSTCPI